MSSLFIFGAGASFGSGPCTPKPPPLGSELFGALRAMGGVAASVSNQLADLFRDFEAGMDRFWVDHNTQTAELLRDMARFLVQFEPLDDNLYIQLISILSGTRKKAVFATTNYDLLIEHAIIKFGYLIAYGGLPVPPGNIPILKIHGSCNFLPALPPLQISNILFDCQAPGSAILEVPVRVAQSTREILDFCSRENSIAPVIAMYHPSKRVLVCPDFVNAQKVAFQSAIKSASSIYIIGLRVHLVDEHIWKPLAASKGRIYYVGREPDEFLKWARPTKRKTAFNLGSSFAHALPKIANHFAA